MRAMATMFPRTLNPDERITKSEVQIFDALEVGLPDEWHVFHSVGWIARDHAEGATDGEIDLMLNSFTYPQCEHDGEHICLAS